VYRLQYEVCRWVGGVDGVLAKIRNMQDLAGGEGGTLAKV
jgi:hypothetical protein